MPTKHLPANPDLAHLKHQAKDLRKAHLACDVGANQRIREFHPKFREATDAEISAAKFSLSDSQFAIAREYGFASWAKLKARLDSPYQSNSHLPYHERIGDPEFRRAVELLDAGNAKGLRGHLEAHRALVRQRVFFSVGGYFGEPTLLEFAAENPVRRGSLPPNIVDVARVVLDAGAKGDKPAIDRTLELVSSGRVARECGVQTPLIALLCDRGADPNAAMGAALGHGEFDAVQSLLTQGASLDLPAASATGRADEALELLPGATSGDRHRALAYASQFGRLAIVRMLLDVGEDPSRFNPLGCHSHSTPLHQAALSGNLEMVHLLVERGADLTIKDIMWGGTPLGWAEHSGQFQVAEFLKSQV